MMRINKNLPLSIVMSLTVPIVGLVLAFMALDSKGKNRLVLLTLSAFWFFMLIKIPPLGDLYRRYLEINAYQDTTTLTEIISSHPDVLLYLHGWFFQQWHIPFFFMPAMYAATMCYFYLAALRNLIMYHQQCYPQIQVTQRSLTFVYLVVFCSFNVLNYTLGMRYGTAFILTIYAVTCFISRSRLRGCLFFAIALLMHFSMAFIVAIFVASRFIRIKKKHVLLLSLFFYLISSVTLRSLLPNITFMGIGSYAMNGYVDGSWSAVPDDSNTLIVAFITRSMGFVLLLYYLADKSEISGFDRFLNLYIPACFIMAISYTAMGRYLSIAQCFIVLRIAYLYLFSAGFHTAAYRCLLRNFLVIFACVSLLVINLYAQRRTLMMGGLGTYAWTSPIFLLNYRMDDFEKYLIDIDYDGYWIRNR